jgi:hypothetical protein
MTTLCFAIDFYSEILSLAQTSQIYFYTPCGKFIYFVYIEAVISVNVPLFRILFAMSSTD